MPHNQVPQAPVIPMEFPLHFTGNSMPGKQSALDAALLPINPTVLPIETELENTKKLHAQVKAKFEDMYGVDQEGRTPEQWRALVMTYGWDIVEEKEGMTRIQIEEKCKPKTFSEKLHDSFKEKRKA